MASLRQQRIVAIVLVSAIVLAMVASLIAVV